MKRNKPQQKLIHIKAESMVLSVSVIVPEKKAVSMLEDIRDGWRSYVGKKRLPFHDKLKVQTCVHNPTLF